MHDQRARRGLWSGLSRPRAARGPAAVRPALGPSLDQSVDGQWKFAATGGFELIDPAGTRWRSHCPTIGRAQPARPARRAAPRGRQRGRRSLRGIAWHDDLGGMGAGYAAALDGALSARWGRRPIRPAGQSRSGWPARRSNTRQSESPDHAADWTLLVTSGEHRRQAADRLSRLPCGARPGGAIGRLARAIVRPARGRVAAQRSCRRVCCGGRAPACGCLHRRCGTCSTASFPSRDSRRPSMSSAAIASSGRRSKTARKCAGSSRSWL